MKYESTPAQHPWTAKTSTTPRRKPKTSHDTHGLSTTSYI